jgi:ABC-2 type transport system ATP-binding protein
MHDAAVAVVGLEKRYGNLTAVRGIDLEVCRGEVFAILGPNGAGKTTTVEILEGFVARDAGSVEVLGLDPGRDQRSLYQRIGVVLQECAVEPYLTVIETLSRHARYYDRPRSPRQLLELVGLRDKAKCKVRTLSGGQRRRLDLGLALVGNPELLFLDEPTTGFDPGARRGAWEIIRKLADEGQTVLLTTHYMDEAHALADRIAVLSGGTIVATGTPESIGGRDAGATRIRFALPDGVGADELPLEDALLSVEPAPGRGRTLELLTSAPTAVLARLTAWAVTRGVELCGLEVLRPSLEDVYLAVTAAAARPA